MHIEVLALNSKFYFWHFYKSYSISVPSSLSGNVINLSSAFSFLRLFFWRWRILPSLRSGAEGGGTNVIKITMRRRPESRMIYLLHRPPYYFPLPSPTLLLSTVMHRVSISDPFHISFGLAKPLLPTHFLSASDSFLSACRVRCIQKPVTLFAEQVKSRGFRQWNKEGSFEWMSYVNQGVNYLYPICLGLW